MKRRLSPFPPFRQLTLGDSGYGVVFTGKKGAMVALWDAKKKSRLIIPVGSTPFALRNFFGEPISVTQDADGKITVDLEGAPQYLSFPSMDGEACSKVLGQAKAG